MLLVVFDQLGYLLDKLVLSEGLGLLLLLGCLILCLVHIDLLGLLTGARWFVQTRL
jgi:hypothetical protein